MGKKLKSPPLIYVLTQVSIGSILSIAKSIPDLQDQIRKDFPDSKMLTIQSLNFSPDAPQVSTVEQWYFADRDRTTGLIVDANNIFIHTIKYTTFEEILEKYINFLDKFNKTVDGFSYSKLGVRYVNCIANPENNVHEKFLGFNLSGRGDIEDQYIAKTETFQKTRFGSVRVRASTFNDQDNNYTINTCMPPDLIETVNKLDFDKNFDKLFDNKFTVLDIDHYTSNGNLNDFAAIDIKDKLIELHNVIETVFLTAVTENAIKQWS